MAVPFFSIVTPSFSQLDWLKLCVASVRDQVLTPSSDGPSGAEIQHVRIEHIIQDNCTPGIDRLADELGAEFYRDRCLVSQGRYSSRSVCTERYTLRIYSEPDQGMYDAVNRGFQRACGDYLAFLNADDQYLKGSLQDVARFFAKNQNIDMAFGDVLIVDPEGSYLCTRIVSKPSGIVTGIHTLSIFTAATFFRRKLLLSQNAYFQPHWRIIGDAVWILDHLRLRTRMGLVGKPLAAATETGENMILSPCSREESAKLRTLQPVHAYLLKPFVVAFYRARRMLQGAYCPKPCSYSIYTRSNSHHRKKFIVRKATHRLKGRFG